MTSERRDEGKGRNIAEASKIVSNDVLTNWNAELCKQKHTAVSAPVRAAGNSARLTQKPESNGTKAPSSSQIREDAQTVKPSKKGDSGKTTTDTPKRNVRENRQGRKARQMMAANGKTHRPLLPFMERTKPQPKWLPTL